MNDHINRRRWLLAGAGVAAALAGCGGGIDDDVRLRAVNATEDIDSIDVDYNDWTFAFDVRQGGDVTSYAQKRLLVIGAAGLFEVFRARDSLRLYDSSRSLPEGDTASVVVMGGRDAGIRLRLIDEDADPPFNGDRLRLRVLHALPGVGALDVHLTGADTPLNGRPADWALDGYDELSAFVERPAGASATRLRVTRRGDTSSVLFDNRSFDPNGGSVGALALVPGSGSQRIAVTALPHGGTGRRYVNGG